jgi:ribosomal protein S21
MDVRLLARGLRAKPTWLQPQALPQFTLANVRYNSSNTPQRTPPKSTAENTEAKPMSDFDDILNKLDLNQRPRENQGARRIFSDSLSRAVGQGTQSSLRYKSRTPPPVRKVEMKLGPTLGRQAHVEPERGFDLASALRRLQGTISQNKIRQEAAAQRFHVRKGMVRKQKKMARWKKLFKFSFQGTVQKIQRMQAQGW